MYGYACSELSWIKGLHGALAVNSTVAHQMSDAAPRSERMLQLLDVPSYAVIKRMESVPGVRGNELPLEQYMPRIRELLHAPQSPVVVEAATGSGKSKLLPSEFYWAINGEVLVLNPSTIDTMNVCSQQRAPSQWAMGGGRWGGDTRWGKIHFHTVGLAFKHYASQGADAFKLFEGVLFDEAHLLESDPIYALLWEVFLCIAKTRRLSMLCASATFSERLRERLKNLNARWVSCHERPYELQRNIVSVATTQQVYDAIAYGWWGAASGITGDTLGVTLIQ